jgi:asparagine synthase (glutamine-hydrolysing)
VCGVAGIAALPGAAPPDRDRIEAMCATIVHRGPDEQGIDIRDGVGLGARRLSIIDVAEGHQPLFNEDETVRLVFNGEIYNYRELREWLIERGHRFHSATDGEVLVHLWEEDGSDFLRRVNGMFAFALFDARQRRLLLARDRLGIKPLFYAATDGHLVFGSEVKAVLASGLVERQIDLDALGQFLAWEYVPAPDTLFADIKKLWPGHCLSVDLETGAQTCESYWDVSEIVPDGDGVRRAEEWEEAVDEQVRKSVQRQLVSDVPLGAFLSGGVDSSLVVSGMGPASTFSIGFDDKSYNELPWSEAVADHLGVTHTTEVIQPDVVALFEKLMHFMDDPVGDFSIFPTYLVSRLARRSVTVALSGDGGDELFGGYETYVAQLKARTYRKIPGVLRAAAVEPLLKALPPRPEKKGLVNKAKRFVEGLEHDERLAHARWRLFVGEVLRRSLFTPEALDSLSTPPSKHVLDLFGEAGDREEINRCLYVDMKSYLIDNCLVKVDRMSMACSLEARVPLLDHELVELALRIPADYKVRGETTKPLLKRVAARHVPAECVYRPKEGFSIPIKHWLGTTLKPLMQELLAPSRIAEDGIFRVDTVERLIREHLDGRANHSHVLWSLMVFQDWKRRWAA